MKNKDQHKTVVEGYINNNMHMAKMISDSPRQMILLNQCICGLGIMFLFNQHPDIHDWKIVLMPATFAAGFFISRFIEKGIVEGSGFIRQGNKKSGLSIVIPMFLISAFLGDMFFYSIVSLTGSASILAEAASIIIGIALPMLQVLQQIYKKEEEMTIKEYTSSTEMNTHMYEKKRENLIASTRLSTVEESLDDPETMKMIKSQVLQGLLREIGSIEQPKENIIDSNIEEVEKVDDVEIVEVEQQRAVEVEIVDNVLHFPTHIEEGKDIDEILSTLSVEQLKVLISPQHRMKRIELAKQCQINDATVARKIKRLIDKLSVEKEA